MNDEKRPNQNREVPKSPTTTIHSERGEVKIKGSVPRMENPPPPPKNKDK